MGDRKCRDPPLRSKASVIGEGTGCEQPMNYPGSQRTTCRHRAASESTEPLVGRLGVGAQARCTAKTSRISRYAAKSGCAREWGGWGRLSEDGPGQNNPVRSEGPWGRADEPLARRCPQRAVSLCSVRGLRSACDEHEGRMQTARRDDLAIDGKAPSDRPALKP